MSSIHFGDWLAQEIARLGINQSEFSRRANIPLPTLRTWLKLPRSEIRDDLWEAFVEANANDLVYFRLWYLDQVCPDWKAVIVARQDKWLAVMPIQFRRKLGFSFSLQPMFCKYLGVLFSQDIASFEKRIRKSLGFISENDRRARVMAVCWWYTSEFEAIKCV